ncbi:hypothetical protein OKW21_000704 [Catalinimonas alkaloidigena]|uniref:hypothetical protein n=1 Tax=Catalinimonas alkaloidigena TaxID=1075417 RepID=UPI0024055F31|nr:hypothetical protein [Catalinimonas alkaloidigena]MDF9795441.1 hypothetical protein [Catalinimonas alkaloidigena]
MPVYDHCNPDCPAGLPLFFVFTLHSDLVKHKKLVEKISTLKTTIIGFVLNFLDVLGTGAIAPLTALLKSTRQTEGRVLFECHQNDSCPHTGIGFYPARRSRVYYIGEYVAVRYPGSRNSVQLSGKENSVMKLIHIL